MIIRLEVSLIRAVYGVEREFDRYYMRLKHQLRGNTNFLLSRGDHNLIEYAVNRTMNRKDAWDKEEYSHELEDFEDT